MARSLASLAVLAVLLGGCISVHETQRVCDEPMGTTYTESVQAKGPARVLRHVVLFQFQEGASAEDIRKVETAFNALPSKIDQIYAFEWGADVSTENLTKGYTHCFVVSFLSEADRDTYAKHPAHVEFAGSLKPVLGDVMVIDYWAD
jgi:hypothetical protein